METRYKLMFGSGSGALEQVLTLEEIREGKGAYDNRRPRAIYESCGFGDKFNTELFEHDMIINTFRNGNLPHRIEWDSEKGAWVGVYEGMKYIVGEERKEITKVNSK